MSPQLVRMAAAAAMLVSTQLSAAQQAAPAQPKAAKKVCKEIVPTGTIMAKRFCLTKTEWQEFDTINGKSADGILSRRGAGTCASGNVLECSGQR